VYIESRALTVSISAAARQGDFDRRRRADRFFSAAAASVKYRRRRRDRLTVNNGTHEFSGTSNMHRKWVHA